MFTSFSSRISLARLLGLLLLVSAFAACQSKSSTTENSGSGEGNNDAVGRTECPAGQHSVDGACVTNAAE